ncbi:MAG: thioesterase family protein [Clostridiales bacterium]|nr:thioesterase family protein [Clostridiales bacterium]
MEIKPYIRQANYYETDQMGVIHHSNYIRWFEEARLDYMNQAGLSYRKMEELGIIIPVLSASCQYRQSVYFGDVVEITLTPVQFTGVKFAFTYNITNQKTGQLCTTGETSHCFLNRDMKPLRLKRDYPEIYERFEAAMKN